jgi:hypothetical protein
MAVTWVTYSPDFAQWKCQVIARQRDDAAGWICLDLIAIESIAEADVENTGHDGINSVLGVPMRHEPHA